jgi:hypothetical protein
MRPIHEKSPHDKIAGLGHGMRQLERRPTDGKFVILIGTPTTAVAVGDAQQILGIPEDLDETSLVAVGAYVTTVSSSGLVTVQIRNITQANADMLSTKITIDANEKDSKTAATQAVINLTVDDVLWGDQIAVDVDVAGTGAKGLAVRLAFA